MTARVVDRSGQPGTHLLLLDDGESIFQAYLERQDGVGEYQYIKAVWSVLHRFD